MRMISIRAVILIGAFLLALSLSGNGCGKKPTGPILQPEEHIFYVASRLNDSKSLIKTFSVEQAEFIDSFVVDSFEIYDMAVLGNNEKLFLAGRGNTRIYDIKTKRLIYSTNKYCCNVNISMNSEYYKLSGGGGIRLFHTINYNEIYYDSNGTTSGVFSHDSNHFLYVRHDSVVSYNIKNDSIETAFQLTRNGSLFKVYKIWPTTDMKKLFLTGNQGWLLYFAVTDFGKDSVRILQAPLRTWGEDAVVSPDGKYLYFVNTPYIDAEMPRMKIDVYDVATEQLVTSISTNGQSPFEPEHIALSSDGKYIMATPWAMGGEDVLLIDAKGFSVIGRYHFGDQISPEIVCTKI